MSALAMAVVSACGGSDDAGAAAQAALVEEGRQIFRFDTFGDEVQWTDALRLHEVIAAAVDPVTALSVGLKVDAEALPAAVVAGIQDGSIDLHSPATTVALLKLGAVVGVKGTVEPVDGVDTLTRVGITCALCHSTVDNSFAPGIGKRLDGWANRDLDPGAIIALSPAVGAATKLALQSWGPGKFDPRHNVDGLSKPVVIPPAYGLEGINRITFTGDGDEIAYWNRYVAVVEMGGLGTMSEPRLNLEVIHGTQDLVSSKLPALQAYQLSLKAPAAPAGSFDVAAAARGKLVFEGAGQCATCHAGASFTDANQRLHPVSDSMAEPETPSYASRSATKQYRTSPLKGLWQHAP
jgi:cytochrome c5